MSPNLPAELVCALERVAEGVSRTALAGRAARISETYRCGGGSTAISNSDDALAYALTRMPATYATVGACLDAISAARPDFAPRSMIDVGSGPATATWAVAKMFVSLRDFALVDSNEHLRALALELMRDNPRLRRATYRASSARAFLNGAADADLVIASYVIGELDAAEQLSLVTLMWQRTRDTLLIVEPGTPAGYQRILAVRAELLAQDAHVIAPCPHDRACPLVAPDWCHFAQRLPRSRDHKLLKAADVPFEDEKFSYVALSRVVPTYRPSRVLAEPVQTKVAIAAKLCTDGGLANVTIARRDKDAYAKARRKRWGDAVD